MTPEDVGAPGAGAEDVAERTGRYRLKPGVSLRQHSAFGTIVNAVFNVVLTLLGFVKNFVLVAFLTPQDYGLWGILLISLGTLTWLKQVGIMDKYVQQDDEDQEVAFHRAFTMELMANAILLVVVLAAVPLMALAYDDSRLLLPGFVMCLIIPAGQLQVPLWIFYRRLEFARQRLYQSVDPLVAFAATVVLAILGAGYWSLVLGVLAGSWAGALLAMRITPYPIRLDYDRETMRSYVGFSAPLFVASIGGIIIAQGSIFVGDHALGLAGAGIITLSAQISQLAQRVDDIVSTTLYPVVCAVRDRVDVLYETFEKSNRIALMWAMPFGFGLALFASDIVHYVIGERWRDAVPVLAATGIGAAVTQLGFNWTSYFRASGQTRPIAVYSITQAVAFLASIPMIYAWGIGGYAATIGVMAATTIAVRSYYLAQLFDGFAMARHAVRALAPSIPAILVVLLVRRADAGMDRSAAIAAAEVAIYGVATLAATLVFERDLLREAIGYVRRRTPPVSVPAGA